MRAAEILNTEHHWIRAMLDCLERLVEHARGPEGFDSDAAAELVFLFEEFADGQHQRKEEELVFPRLLAKAGPAEEEVLGELLEDHVYERTVLENLRASLATALNSQPPDLTSFAENAAACLALHRTHVENESAALLPMLDRILDDEDDAEIVAGFRHLEAVGANSAGLFEQVRSLCHRLGVPEPDGAESRHPYPDSPA